MTRPSTPSTNQRTWMPGTYSAKTRVALLPGHDDITETVPRPRYFRPQAGNNEGTRRFSLHCGGAQRTSTGVVMYVWLALFLIVADVSAAFAQGHQGTSQ